MKMKRYFFYSETELLDVLEGDRNDPEFNALVKAFEARPEVVSIDWTYAL